MSELTGHERPDPHAVRDADELVAALRQLRAWAGEPSLRRLTALAGQRRLRDGHLVDALPSSTLSDNLGGRRLPRLPRRSFVTAFVAACMRARRCPDDEIMAEIQRWRHALRRLEATAPPDTPRPEVPASRPAEAVADEAGHPTSGGLEPAWPSGQPTVEVSGESDPPGPHQPHRWTAGPVRALQRAGIGRTRAYAAAVGLLVLVVAVGVVITTGRDKSQGPRATAEESASPRPSSPTGEPSQPGGSPESGEQAASPRQGLPAAGWYSVQPGHTRHLNYCWGEGRERNGNTNRTLVVQRPCAEAMRTRLVPLGGGVYRFEWLSPQGETGCLAVDFGDQATQPGALLSPRRCDYGGNRFRLEPVAGGFRFRPVHSGLCVGTVDGVGDTGVGAEAMQDRCTGAADQRFALTARD